MVDYEERNGFIYTTNGMSVADAKRYAKEEKLPVVLSSCKLIDTFAFMNKFQFKKKVLR